jgi:hypothetical protein
MAEKDIKNGDYESPEKVFSDLRKEILENGWENKLLQCECI